ncbi:hypothetical protein [Candidatus Magnetaquicoccus inordinatus]|uniref:hypothetical protein n=1 Tax=Candidatus Magnetaquicoccus inordinatus TaxID=2496818 RepID=UPI00102CA861|nr:hypothetical protein [Candidatus Magnetaquicoccus inordinatus]
MSDSAISVEPAIGKGDTATVKVTNILDHYPLCQEVHIEIGDNGYSLCHNHHAVIGECILDGIQDLGSAMQLMERYTTGNEMPIIQPRCSLSEGSSPLPCLDKLHNIAILMTPLPKVSRKRAKLSKGADFNRDKQRGKNNNDLRLQEGRACE